MKIGLLTSSRADYSIYLPLLNLLKEDSFFDLSIIAFGTHLSEFHGNTVDAILQDGFEVPIRIHTLPEDDSPAAISQAIGQTVVDFSSIWESHKFDLVFCLGDRYEMFGACVSSIPFNVKLAHIHGGEKTLGAFDDSFRHAITHMSSIHFASSEQYRQRIIRLKESDVGVYNVGALSIDNLRQLTLLSLEEFKARFNIDLSIPTILITFHPETVSFAKNEMYIHELIGALKEIKGYQFVITMPNSDTMGNMIRGRLKSFIAECPTAIGVESFGTIGYLSCMKHCAFMLGNTSSGFIEASFFRKYVINLGDRQNGRIITPNINVCQIDKRVILKAVEDYLTYEPTSFIEIYGNGNAAENIIQILKNTHDQDRRACN